MKSLTQIIRKHIIFIGLGLISFFALFGYLQKEKMPDFSSIGDVTVKKERFFQYLSPMIAAENKRIQDRRKKLTSLWHKQKENSRLSRSEKRWLRELAEQYGLAAETQAPVAWERLMRRVDTVPMSLALVQAAVESAWGTSRFAKQGKNLFGQHCFTQGCGIVPDGAADNAGFEVEKFNSVEASVRSYIHNLNTHRAYTAFRKQRQNFRNRGEKPDAHTLAQTLHQYSGQKHTYTQSLQAMIKQNKELIQTL